MRKERVRLLVSELSFAELQNSKQISLCWSKSIFIVLWAGATHVIDVSVLAHCFEFALGNLAKEGKEEARKTLCNVEKDLMQIYGSKSVPWCTVAPCSALAESVIPYKSFFIITCSCSPSLGSCISKLIQ